MPARSLARVNWGSHLTSLGNNKVKHLSFWQNLLKHKRTGFRTHVVLCAESTRRPPFRYFEHLGQRQLSRTTPSPVSSDDGTLTDEWDEHKFLQVAESSLESISESVSTIGFESHDPVDDFDVDLSQGVLTIQAGTVGTYVLNTQTPNRQIWMSSPLSGPWRYAWHPRRSEWLSTRDGHCLSKHLSDELSQLFGKSVTISFNQVSNEQP